MARDEEGDQETLEDETLEMEQMNYKFQALERMEPNRVRRREFVNGPLWQEVMTKPRFDSRVNVAKAIFRLRMLARNRTF